MHHLSARCMLYLRAEGRRPTMPIQIAPAKQFCVNHHPPMRIPVGVRRAIRQWRGDDAFASYVRAFARMPSGASAPVRRFRNRPVALPAVLLRPVFPVSCFPAFRQVDPPLPPHRRFHPDIVRVPWRPRRRWMSLPSLRRIVYAATLCSKRHRFTLERTT